MRDGNLRQIFAKHLPMVLFTAIETGGTGRGIPDSEYCVEGQTGWIEFKMARGQDTGLRPEQYAWAARRMRAKGRVFIAVRSKTTTRDELWFMTPSQWAPKLQDCGGWIFHGGPKGWDWDRILGRMMK